MPSIIGSIIRKATRKENEPLNILCSSTHEAIQTNMCKTGHNFFAFNAPGIKGWNEAFRPIPRNYTILDGSKANLQLPIDIDFDLVLTQEKFNQFPRLFPIARNLHIPLISLEHCLPMQSWPAGQIEQMKQMKGDINLFISDFSRKKWGWDESNSEVIHHGIDTKTFAPNPRFERENKILHVANDFIWRGYILGKDIWDRVTNGLPTQVVGDTTGLSIPAKSVHELVRFYQTSLIYFNTSRVSPIPTSMLEAMSAGCAIVSTATAMIPEIIQDGVNGYITNDEREMRVRLDYLLKNPDKAKELGMAARQTILEKFSLEKFIENWNNIFYRAANIIFTGEFD